MEVERLSIPIMSSAQSQASVVNGQAQPLALKEGQMVHGQIKQLFPGQKAEIQIGNQSMVAQLEVPMKAGDSYYFQVSSVKPELELKIIAGPTSSTQGTGQQLNKLMEAMQLPKSNEMTQLLNFAMKNKMPITRETLIQAEALLKNVPTSGRAEALQAIQKIVELKLPMTEMNFRSLISAQSKEGLNAVLTSLRASLLNDTTVSADVKNLISTALEKVAKPFAQATGNALLANSLVNLLEKSGSAESRFATVQLLKSVGILPERTSLANLPQVLTSMITNETSMTKNTTTTLQQTVQNEGIVGASQSTTQKMGEITTVLRQISPTSLNATTSLASQLENLKTLVKDETSLTSANKAILNSLVDQVSNTKKTTESVARFVQQFNEVLVRITAENSLASPFAPSGKEEAIKQPLLALLSQGNTTVDSRQLTALAQAAERSGNLEVQKLLQLAEGTVATAVEGKAMKEAMQTVMRSLGLNYEAALLGKDPDIARLAETLKPQLLDLMQNSAVSQIIRDGAEAVVSRMNGPLLMSGENGVQHQLVMQVPLEFFGKRIDATLEWNGRMKEGGKIDPDFARILFYLDLHSLKKTVIDMQVQNKVVSVTVFNASHTIKTIGTPMVGKLKEGLNQSGYKLSGVFFKDFQSDKKETPDTSEEIKTNRQGVDFRI